MSTQYQADIPPIRPDVIQFNRRKGWCDHCKRHPAPSPQSDAWHRAIFGRTTNDLGTHLVVISATDTRGASTRTQALIEVTGPDLAPRLTRAPAKIAVVGRLYTSQLVAFDPRETRCPSFTTPVLRR